MRFGTHVLVTRGGSRSPMGTPGSLREVKGTYIGGQGNQVYVRLDQDDPLATGGYCTEKGSRGVWSRSAMRLDIRVPGDLRVGLRLQLDWGIGPEGACEIELLRRSGGPGGDGWVIKDLNGRRIKTLSSCTAQIMRGNPRVLEDRS